MVHTLGNSRDMAPLTFSQTQISDETDHFSYMRLLNDPTSDDDANVGVNDLCHPSIYSCSIDNPQGQQGLKRINDFSFFQQNQYFGIPSKDFSPWSPYQGVLNIENVIDCNVKQRQNKHFVQPQQYAIGRSPSSTFGTSATQCPLQKNHDSLTYGTGFSFPVLDNRDLDCHDFKQYQLFKQPQPQPSLYNPRGKEVAPGDDYGLLGFLKTIKGANPTKKDLAVGVDLHSLGLELTSLEPLHPKFASPWSYEPVKEGPKFDIPDCYNCEQPPPLKRLQFKKFHLPTLFFIFYSMPQDQAQLLAANELHDRGWYFHRALQMWFTRDNTSVPTVKNTAYEIGCYICFDPETWQMIRKDNVVLYYRMIEQRPEIPL